MDSSMTKTASVSTVLSLVKIARLHAVFVGFFMYLLGALLACVAGASFSVPRFTLGYIILCFAQLSVSYSNEYYDVLTDQFSAKNFFSGGSKVLVEHPEFRRLAKWCGIGFLLLSIILTGVFVFVFSFSLLFFIFVVGGNLVGWYYTAPPLQLSYHGLGEITTMIAIGVFIPEIGYWALNGGMDAFSLLFAVPFGLYGLALIIDVEIPDKDADVRANKKNLVVRKGIPTSLLIDVCALALASLFFVTLSLINGEFHGIDFHLVLITSLVPLGTGVFSFLRRNAPPDVLRRSVFSNVASLFLLVLFMDFYLLFLVIT